jgi:predicted permease
MRRRKRMLEDLDQDIREHIERETQDNIERGMSPEEARHAAFRKFGNVTRVKEETREVWSLVWLEQLLEDIRYGLRMLRNSPGFTAVAILTLALGIGANTAIFSFVNAWILHPLPYPQGDRLVVFLGQNKKSGSTSLGIEAANFNDIQREVRDFEELCTWSPAKFNLTSNGQPERVQGYRVGWNFFETLGAKPALGRAFLPQEDEPGAAHVVILSRGLWETRFASDPHILGRNMQIGGESYTVVGVMPAKFQLPLTGDANIWVPLALSSQERADRQNGWLFVIGRLKPGVSLAQGQEEVSRIASQLEKAYPKTNADSGILLHTLEYEIGANQGNEELVICFWIVGLVLLIACANVANLMLSRATGRTKELAVRTALGAGRWRLVRQLVTETVLLFLGGSAAGIGVAYWTLGWIEAAIPAKVRGYLTNYGDVTLDYQTLLYTFAIAFVAGILFGLAPAISSTQMDVHSMLKEASGRASSNRQGARLRGVFVVGEIALALVIVICSTLLVKSLLGLIRSAPGFQPDNVMAAQLDLPVAKYKSPVEIRSFYEQVMDHVRALPQIESAGASQTIPFGDCCSTVAIYAVGKPAPRSGQVPGAHCAAVTPDYLSTMQIGLMKGRQFATSDGPSAPPVVIIDQTLANYFWEHEDPVGQKLRFSLDHDVTATIVGVVQDVKLYNSTSGKHDREMYVPFAQLPAREMGIVVRSRADRATLADAIRRAIWSVDEGQPVSLVRPVQSMMDEQYSGFQVTVKLMGFFSSLALFLGAIGVYAVMAFNVTQRTHEIGIRMALGADPRQVLKLVLGNAASFAGLGIAIGVAVALGASRFLGSLLFGVSATDPMSFVGSALLLAVVAFIACYLPARRAMRVDPLVALRYE